jgi:hypothetical protein
MVDKPDEDCTLGVHVLTYQRKDRHRPTSDDIDKRKYSALRNSEEPPSKYEPGQRKAIEAINGIISFQAVQGPPGTGKSHTWCAAMDL